MSAGEAMAVAVIATGVGNVASVMAGLKRAGAAPSLTVEAARVAEAARVVLPGVGAFGAGMARLSELGLVDVLRERIGAGRPTLAVCLGLQLLAEGSEETPGVAGLGVLPGRARRFGDDLIVPHMGWNRLTGGGPIVGGALGGAGEGAAYFANSYRLDAAPEAWQPTFCDYGGRFVAAVERGEVVACQFHPELSGALGGRILRRWVRGEEVPC